MNKEQLKEALMEYSEKHDVDLKKSWYNLSEENMQKYLDELTGKVTATPKATEVVKGEVSPQNPFGCEIIRVMMPIDKQNPKIKTITFSINGIKLAFPLGKVALMPNAYYQVYLNTMTKEAEAQEKVEAYLYKEI